MGAYGRRNEGMANAKSDSLSREAEAGPTRDCRDPDEADRRPRLAEIRRTRGGREGIGRTRRGGAARTVKSARHPARGVDRFREARFGDEEVNPRPHAALAQFADLTDDALDLVSPFREVDREVNLVQPCGSQLFEPFPVRERKSRPSSRFRRSNSPAYCNGSPPPKETACSPFLAR